MHDNIAGIEGAILYLRKDDGNFFEFASDHLARERDLSAQMTEKLRNS